jgi:SAM-dependent methyltransferase
VADEVTAHNQAAYDQIAGLYAARHTNHDPSFPELRAAFAARLPRNADVADLGCGPAHDGARFARAGHRVAGVDRSAGMLAHAARALPGHVVQGDLRRLPLASQGLDGIWCCAALLHVPHDQTAAALRELRRVLRPGGCLALVTAAALVTAGLVTAAGPDARLEDARLEPVPYAPGTRRWFFYRQAEELGEQLRDAGLRVLSMTEEITSRHWLKILAGVT